MKPNQITDIVLKHVVNLILERIPGIELFDSETNAAHLVIEDNEILIEAKRDESGHVTTLWITDPKLVLVRNDFESQIRVQYEDVENDIDLHRALNLAYVNYNKSNAYNYRFVEFRTNRVQKIFDEMILQLNRTLLNYGFRYAGEIDPTLVMNFVLQQNANEIPFKINVDLTDYQIQLTMLPIGDMNPLLEGIIKTHVRNIETYLNNHNY
jgi:hypothetical protein